ncbi:MAG: hypothetical protein AAFV53_34245 [Myxococcota bacterium]
MTPWAWIRAGLISILLIGHTIEALPLPELKARHFQYAIARQELTRWTEVLNQAGISGTEEEFKADALAFGRSLREGRLLLTRPIRPLMRLTGTGQGWGLFAYPDPNAGRLIVSVEIDGQEQEIYRAPQRSRDRLTRQLRYRRIRGVYDDLGDRPKPGRAYGHLVDWFARQIFNDRPEVDLIRFQIDQMRIMLPGEGPPPPERARHRKRRTRAVLKARQEQRNIP